MVILMIVISTAIPDVHGILIMEDVQILIVINLLIIMIVITTAITDVHGNILPMGGYV
jgi:hypothetical protein